MLTALYAAAARRRREWYAARPEARKRLRHPVVSIGNIAAGGRGKTPCAAFVAGLLVDMGERPAILSRGYARTERVDGVVVVRDAEGMRADLARAGDEPFMLARRLPGVIVVTSPDRYLGGRMAEHHLGATVHVLDDGFQHFQIDRDADIVLVEREDLGGRTFPSGRLREPPDVLLAADAIVALSELGNGDGPGLPAARFHARTVMGPPVFEAGDVRPAAVFAVAGIASPSAFLEPLKSAGWRIAGTGVYRDHHPFSRAEVADLTRRASAAGAEAIVTTEKDYVRLLPHRPFAMPIGFVPLTMSVEPLTEFRQWLSTSLDETRDIVRV